MRFNIIIKDVTLEIPEMPSVRIGEVTLQYEVSLDEQVQGLKQLKELGLDKVVRKMGESLIKTL